MYDMGDVTPAGDNYVLRISLEAVSAVEQRAMQIQSWEVAEVGSTWASSTNMERVS